MLTESTTNVQPQSQAAESNSTSWQTMRSVSSAQCSSEQMSSAISMVVTVACGPDELHDAFIASAQMADTDLTRYEAMSAHARQRMRDFASPELAAAALRRVLERVAVIRIAS